MVKDMAEAQDIYNFEVQYGSQSRDTGKLHADDFTRTLGMCQRESLPFIVAVAGLPHDVRESKVAKTAWNINDPKKGQILGFCFLSGYYTGLCNSVKCTGGSSVRVNMVVHPDHRRKLIGHALLDKTLQMTCTDYTYQDTCAFVNDNDIPLFRGPALSPRRFRHVFVDVLMEENDDAAMAGYNKFLVGRFGFERMFMIRRSHEHRGIVFSQVTYHREARPVRELESAQ
jgi:GNAT superfamily N-acetyltransferase